MRAIEARGAVRMALALLALLSTSAPALAQDKQDLEERLRAALRQAIAESRSLEDQVALLQAKQLETERERQALVDKEAADQKEIAGLNDRLQGSEKSLQQSATELQATNGTLATERGNFAKLQTDYTAETAYARDRDAEAKRLDAALVDTRKRQLDCVARNADLYQLGNEILDRYEHKGIFESLTDDERVTGLKRVELQNLAQGYEDKLRKDEIVAPATHIGN